MTVGQREAVFYIVHVQRLNPDFLQGFQSLGAVRGLHPHGQRFKDLITGINPAVTVVIEPGQLAKAGAAPGTKQFGAVVHFAVAISVQHQVAATAAQGGKLPGFTVTVQVELEEGIGQAGCGRAEVDHQRVGEWPFLNLHQFRVLVGPGLGLSQ